MHDPPFSTWLTFYLLLPALVSGLFAFISSLQAPRTSAALCFGSSILCAAGSMMILSPTVYRGGWVTNHEIAMALSFDVMAFLFVPWVTLFLGFLTVRHFSHPRLMLLIGPLAFLSGIALLFAVAVLIGGSKMA